MSKVACNQTVTAMKSPEGRRNLERLKKIWKDNCREQVKNSLNLKQEGEDSQ
jgi:hypothetical protein